MANTRKTTQKRKKKPQNSVDDVFHATVQKASDLQQTAGEYYEEAVEYVKKNPMKSAIIAGVAGFLIGSVFKR